MLNYNYDEFLKDLDKFLNEEKKKKINNDIREESHSYNEKIIDEVSSVKNIKYDDIDSFTISIRDLEETEKPREKLYKFGPETLTEYELLAILLGSGSKKEDVLNLSKKLWFS